MTWVKIDDRWPRHRKAVAVGPLGRDLFVTGLCYCNEHLTDGFIPYDAVPRLSPGLARPRDVACKLVAAGLWEQCPGDAPGVLLGYRVHDYHEWNRSADEIKELRRSKADRMRRWRGRGAATNGATSGDGGASRGASTQGHVEGGPTPTPPPTPTPQPPLSTGASTARPAHPPEAFNHDCAWPGRCVNAKYFDEHPDAGLPVRGKDDTGRFRPKQCPHHREQDEQPW